jgi:putative intracellular protease/amidase
MAAAVQAGSIPPTGKGKVLICLSGAQSVHLQSGKEQETGYFLKELGRPLAKLLAAGYDVEFANPTGQEPHMDPMSNMSIWFARLGVELEEEKRLIESMKVHNNFSHPRRFSEISDEDLQQYVAVFLPGGHAPMTDLHSDKDLGRILLHFHQRSKPTALICHSPIALLSTKVVEGGSPWAYQGYKMTCYSDTEELLNEAMWMSKLPFKVESELRKNGAQMVEAMPMMPKVTVDRELITAQGPTSVDAFGEVLVKTLQSGNTAEPAVAMTN